VDAGLGRIGCFEQPARKAAAAAATPRERKRERFIGKGELACGNERGLRRGARLLLRP
jgi:hypothetical protein